MLDYLAPVSFGLVLWAWALRLPGAARALQARLGPGVHAEPLPRHSVGTGTLVAMAEEGPAEKGEHLTLTIVDVLSLALRA